MAFWKSFNCATGACERCVDGAALSCVCPHHREGRTVRYCDNCEVKPATSKKYASGFRMCAECGKKNIVHQGVIVPKVYAPWIPSAS